MSKSKFDVDIAKEKTNQIYFLAFAIQEAAKEFSKAGVHDNVKASAVALLERLTNLIESLLRGEK